MNAKKFLLVALIFGLTRLCHAGPQAFIQHQNFQLSQTQSSSVSVYPCLTCPSQASHSNTSCLEEGLSGGVGVQVMF
jgi:hypothetical protein